MYIFECVLFMLSGSFLSYEIFFRLTNDSLYFSCVSSEIVLLISSSGLNYFPFTWMNLSYITFDISQISYTCYHQGHAYVIWCIHSSQGIYWRPTTWKLVIFHFRLILKTMWGLIQNLHRGDPLPCCQLPTLSKGFWC